MPALRKEQKEQTRRRLLDAVADELASGRSFDTLSLREVAKLAGIAPTSFYRHFHDMEDLGFALLDEHKSALLDVMETVRAWENKQQSLIRAMVEAVYDFMAEKQGLSRMIVQESLSPESPFHDASEKLFTSMSQELSESLEKEANEREVPLGYPYLVANLMVSVMFITGIAQLNSPSSDRDRQIDATVTKFKMIMRGAESLAAER